MAHSMTKTILYIDLYGSIKPRRLLFLNSLSEKGFKIQCILWDRKGNLPICENQNGIDIKRFKRKAEYANIKASIKFPNIYYKFFMMIFHEGFDVIHCGHFALLPLALIMAKIRKAKLVYDVSEFFIDDFFRRLPRILAPIHTLATMFESIFVKHVDGVICTPSYQKIMENRYIKCNPNVLVIMNVPELVNEPGNTDALENLVQIYLGRQIIIFSGSILLERGALIILEAVSKVKLLFPNVILLYIGTIFEDIRVKINDMISTLDLKGNVDFVGHVSYFTLPLYLNIGDVAVSLYLPVSRWEKLTKGNARQFGDFMQAGLPVVASNFNEISLVVKEEDCGILVEPTSSAEIADAICLILKNPKLSRRLAANGKNAVKGGYNWSFESNRLMTFYNSLF